MRMTGVEKLLVNHPRKGAANVARLCRLLESIAVPGNAAVLEVGTGAGDVAAFLARERGFDVVGIDMDPGQLALARNRHGVIPGLRFAVADATQLEFPPASFDLIVAQNVFHHMPAWRAAAREVARVLRPSGHLLWLDLTPPRFLAALLRPLAGQAGVYTVRDVLAVFRAAGLEAVQQRPLPRWLPWRHELTLRLSRAETRPVPPA